MDGEPLRRPTSFVGRRLGEFDILERVAEGGFGEVFRAHQPTLGRDAVIKVLASGKDGTSHERFTREAQLASRLDHPYAAHIYAFGTEADGAQWIAMELVRGTSLAELLKTLGPLPVARFVPLFQAICQVVHAAHEQGIVHRDLKPANVMVVARAGVLLPKLLDFGIARVYSGDDKDKEEAEHELEARLEHLLGTAETLEREPATEVEPTEPAPAELGDTTVELDPFEHEMHQLLGQRFAEVVTTPRDRTDLTGGAVYLGSPLYMAPELWLGPQAAGPACDIYALGVLAFECLTGRPPFEGDRPLVVARAHLSDPLPPLDPAAPRGLHAVVARAMAKRPRDRFPDALALSRAVEAACRTEAAPQLALPRPAADLVAAVVARAPQPIAELLASAEASALPEDAWTRYVALLELVAHYAGVLGLASWCRLGRPDPDGEVRGIVRRLCQAGLEPAEWLSLAAAVTRPFARTRDAFPLPELVDLCHGSFEDRLRGRLGEYRRGEPDPDRLAALVEAAGDTISGAAVLFEYDVVVLGDRGCEQWNGPRRRPRPILASTTTGPDGAPVLLDRNRAPVLSLWPLAKAIAPTPAADAELFLVAGLGRYGARLVASPVGYERQDPELATWLEELAGGVGPEGAEGEQERTPYRGLASFSVEDSDFFFGRERESENLANHLRARSFAAVVGPSGAGKSSFVQAGVVPLLSTDWRAIVMRPGASPFRTLYERLVSAGLEPPELPASYPANPPALMVWLDREARRRGMTIMLVVDQAEELVTLCRDEAERTAFALCLAAVRDGGRVRVVLTLRDDFLMRLQRLPGLGERLTNGIHLLGTPSPGDLGRILTEPARRMGYDFEDPALVDEMVGAVADNPSALALLSFTAARLWELRDRQFRKLRRSVYASIGGVGGALAQHAEDVIVGLSSAERELVREAFRHLVTADGTRAVIAKSELSELLGGDAQAARVIETLVSARLAVTAEGSGGQVAIEITHEALLESWPRLVTWRRDDAENARLRDQLRASARQWDTRGRQRGMLWRGDVLVEYRMWRSRYRGRLTELEDAFATACLREQARGVRRRRALTSAAFAVLTAAAVVLYIFAARARTSASHATARTIELMEEQGRRDLLDQQPLRAAAPLARAYALGGRHASLRFLLARAMAAVESQGAVLRGHKGFVRRAMFSADGKRVVTASDDETLRLWDASTGAEITSVPTHGLVRLAHTGDGAIVAGASAGEVTVWNTADLGVVTRWKLEDGVQPSVTAIADDAKQVIVGDAEGGVHVFAAGAKREQPIKARHQGAVKSAAASGRTWATGGEDGRVIVGRDGATTVLVHGELAVLAVAFDPAGGLLASGGADGTVKLWSVETGMLERALTGHAKSIRAVTFSPDGARLATASEDGTVRLWTIASELPPVVLAGHQGVVASVKFDRAGRQLVSGGADRTVRLWDVASGAPLASLDANLAEVWSAEFDQAGDRVVTAGFDQTARIWNIPRRDQRLPIAAPEGGFTAASYSADGGRIVTAGLDGTARIFSTSGQELITLPGSHGPVRAAAMSPDGSVLVTGTDSGTAQLWSLDRRAVTAELEGAKDGVNAVRFRPDGSQVTLGGGDGIARVFDPRSGRLIRRLAGHTAGIWGVSYSADGTLVATASDDRTAKIWDSETGRPVRTLGPFPSEVNAAVFDPHAERIATVGTDGTLRLFRVRDGALLGQTTAHHDNISTASFSADGERVITASLDHTVVVWDAVTLRELARLQRHTDAVLAIELQPGTENLMSAGADGAIWLTNLDLERRPPAELDRLIGQTRAP